jgi:hypothetical protein
MITVLSLRYGPLESLGWAIFLDIKASSDNGFIKYNTSPFSFIVPK